MSTSDYLTRPLRSLATAQRETRDEQLRRLRFALDRAESLSYDAYGDLTTQREQSLMAEIQNWLRDAVEALKFLEGRDEVAEETDRDHADLKWFHGRVL